MIDIKYITFRAQATTTADRRRYRSLAPLTLTDQPTPSLPWSLRQVDYRALMRALHNA
jgi:hypothetical protein